MKEQIDRTKLPRHIAIIMDGNGRWAKQRGAMRVFGHRNAIKAVREATEGCAELGVEYLTLYAFSTENWGRPEAEVRALMELLVHTIADELPTLQKNNVRLNSIGDIDSLPNSCQRELQEAIDKTKQNTGLNLILALGYSGKWDIVQATQQLAREVKAGTLRPEDITESLLNSKLSTLDRPEVDLMLRTGGDHRISNFLLWQLAYAELYFYDDVFWPDFRRNHLHEAILSFQQRERRFGKTSEQILSDAK
ncbi:isoprenyl transferase [Runella sp. CRIBMP]|uniref:Isoprenyl transferase n=1 Tax=Runella salmonicolor TaxID=2950278 RepID=A0ABT1FS23_9BACT|nr:MULTISPECIES: isoprenyl transferase [Runella]MCP1383433.1 isoprenyl transferase [Runella salmonicolor]NBB20293.1 isoprenyl transferase [Runella sp. CRIBMP]